MEWERKWRDEVARMTELFEGLPADRVERLSALARSLRRLKEQMQELAAGVDAAAHCAQCGGACCVSGRYHVTGVDLLVFLALREPLFAPRFGNGLCPYLGKASCLIEPGYRPFNCITFICDLIEDQLPREEVARFYLMERELSKGYRELEALFPGAARPLL